MSVQKRADGVGSDGVVTRLKEKPMVDVGLLPEVVEGYASADVFLRESLKWVPGRITALTKKHAGFEGVIVAVPGLYEQALDKGLKSSELTFVDESVAQQPRKDVRYWVLVDEDKLRDKKPGQEVLADVAALMEEAAGRKLEYSGAVTVEDILSGADNDLVKEALAVNTLYLPLTINPKVVMGFHQYLRDKGVD